MCVSHTKTKVCDLGLGRAVKLITCVTKTLYPNQNSEMKLGPNSLICTLGLYLYAYIALLLTCGCQKVSNLIYSNSIITMELLALD